MSSLLLLLTSMAMAAPDGVATFEVFAQETDGAGWVLHHVPDRGDSLWGCPSVASMGTCTPLRFDDWRPGADLDLLHVSQEDARAWLRMHIPGLGAFLYACSAPTGEPTCERVDLDLLPANSHLQRIWPPLPTRGCDPSTDPTSPACVTAPADESDLWIQAGPTRHGPVNLYACTGLATTPTCTLTVPNWLAVDREDLGFRRLEDLRSQDETGHAVYGPGVRVLALAPGSVAEATGLQPQDIIMKIDGFTVRQVRHARHLLAQIPAETAVTLQLQDGRELTLTPRRESTTQAP